MKKEPTTKLTSIKLNARQEEMIEEIKSFGGHRSMASVLMDGIRLLHAKYFPQYVQLANDKKNLSPEDQAKKKEERATMTEAKKKKEAINLCTGDLAGAISQDGKYCTFDSYQILNLAGKTRVMTESKEVIPMSLLGKQTMEIKYKGNMPFEKKLKAVAEYKKAKK